MQGPVSKTAGLRSRSSGEEGIDTGREDAEDTLWSKARLQVASGELLTRDSLSNQSENIIVKIVLLLLLLED